MKKLLISFFIVLITINHVYADTTFYLLRHAEKVNDETKDPHLSDEGRIRADKLAQYLSPSHINKIYSTSYNRTIETVKPLAELFNLSVETYDPRTLSDFADQLKTETGNIVIVGHSNTTPILTALLSGEAVDNIDDSEYDNLFVVNIIEGKAGLNRSKLFPVTIRPIATKIILDANRFKPGKASYNMLFNGEVVGQSSHNLNKKNGNYLLHEKTTIASMNIDADIHVEVNEKTMAPLSMSMTGSMGTPVDINLVWHANHVKGYSEMTRAPNHLQGRLVIDQTLPTHTVERTSVIMLAHLLKLDENQKKTASWFNGYDGFERDIVISYQGDEKVTVPAGQFDTYKILYQGGAPSQLFYISKSEFPEIIKIEIPTMPWSYELLKSR